MHSDYLAHDAIGLATLVRERKAVSRELLDAAIGWPKRSTARSTRSCCRTTKPHASARPPHRRRRRRAVRRRSLSREGSRRGGRRAAVVDGQPALPVFRARRRFAGDRAQPRGRSQRVRQDQHVGDRPDAVHGTRTVRRVPQPVESRSHARRLERRCGGGRRGRHRAARPCFRRRRLDPHSGVVLRAVRPEAEPQPGTRRPAVERRAGRPACGHAQRARQRAAARRDDRPDLATGRARHVPRRTRHAARPAADRPRARSDARAGTRRRHARGARRRGRAARIARPPCRAGDAARQLRARPKPSSRYGRRSPRRWCSARAR